MHISQAVIRNFRNFDNAIFKFQRGVNTIIGENGSGKTNLFYALRLLLDSNLSRSALYLLEKDFCRKLGNTWQGHWIIISLEFDELSFDEVIQCLAVKDFGFVDAAHAGKGNYNFFYRPKHQARKELFEISNNGEISLDEKRSLLTNKLNEITLLDYEPVLTCRAPNINFSDKDFYKKHIGDFENVVFPDPDDLAQDELGVLAPRSLNIYNDISCTFAEALRNVVSDLKSYRRNPLLTLLRAKEEGIPEDSKREIQNSIKELNNSIGELQPVIDISLEIKNKIKDTVGEIYAPNIGIQANLPDEIDNLLQSLTLRVGDSDDVDFQGNIEDLSLGGANLIYLSLKLLEYSLELKKDKAAHFLFIEEPEAHIHTHIQKTLFQKVSDPNTQVIYSTHSTHISDASKISRINILSKEKNRALVFHPANGLGSDEIVRLERYLDAVRSTLLFAKSVILVEGDGEYLFLPSLVKVVFGVSFDELGVSLVNVGSTGFDNIAKIFHDNRVKKRCSIITDNDQSILPLPDDPKEDSPEQASCRASEKSGNERFNSLKKFTIDNKWINAFFATHTFEVELVSDKNHIHLEDLLQKIYPKQKRYIPDSLSALKRSDVAVYGSEILRLAKSKGKGWFSILFSESLTYNFEIPKYIIEAIAFAIGTPRNSTVNAMIEYRLKNITADAKHEQQFTCAELLTRLKNNKSIDAKTAFIEMLPEDNLTKLINALS